jgi:hypothetical protein
MPTIQITDDDLYAARSWLAADRCLTSATGPSQRDVLESRRDEHAKVLTRNIALKIVQAARVTPIEIADAEEVAEQRRAHGSLEREPGVGSGQVIPRAVAR